MFVNFPRVRRKMKSAAEVRMEDGSLFVDGRDLLFPKILLLNSFRTVRNSIGAIKPDDSHVATKSIARNFEKCSIMVPIFDFSVLNSQYNQVN